MSGRWLLLLVLGSNLAACTGSTRLGELFQPDVYTVRRGDTVYSIAWRYQLDQEAVIRWNRLEPPYAIFPGQKLRLSGSPEVAAAAPSPVGASTAVTPAPVSAPVESGQPASAPSPPPDLAPRRWIWPSDGPVLRGYESSNPARKGLDIGGREGEPVLAAADGRVVYSGNGLPAYGNLIIVRHDEVYLSAYAHNRELLVVEGESVRQGQPIARMGLADDRKALLHFEIRKNGQPIDPKSLLPRR